MVFLCFFSEHARILMAEGAAVDLFCTVHSVPCKVLHITVSPLSSGSILNVQSSIAARQARTGNAIMKLFSI